jgi:hypothetical protein
MHVRLFIFEKCAAGGNKIGVRGVTCMWSDRKGWAC